MSRRAPTPPTKSPHPHPRDDAEPAPPSLAARLARNQVVGAAVGVFSKLGFTAVRVEDLIEAAEISRRTFYKYFQGKEDVLAAVYELASAELMGAVRAAAEKSPDPLEGLRRGVDLYLDFHVENGPLLRTLVEHGFRSDSPLWPLRKKLRAQLGELAARAAAARHEHLDPLMYPALLSALEGLSLELLDNRAADAHQVARAKRVAHVILDRVLGGAAATAGPGHHGGGR